MKLEDLMKACPNIDVMVIGDPKPKPYYAAPCERCPDCGRFDLRQERYRIYRTNGVPHPHDICAVGFTAQGLRALCKTYEFDADLSALEPTPPPTEGSAP